MVKTSTERVRAFRERQRKRKLRLENKQRLLKDITDIHYSGYWSGTFVFEYLYKKPTEGESTIPSLVETKKETVRFTVSKPIKKVYVFKEPSNQERMYYQVLRNPKNRRE